MVAYGCDTIHTGNSDKKQTANVTTTGLVLGPTTSTDVHYVATSGIPSGCSGDSGSPLFNIGGSNPDKIIGITSFGLGSGASQTTHFTRAGNVRRWLDNPQKLNVFAANEMGFLMNQSTLTCLTSDTPGFNLMTACNGVNQPVDKQYWKVLGTAQRFAIQSTLGNTCLAASVGSATVGRAACNTAAAAQQWAFVAAGATAVQASNNLTGTCLTAPSAGGFVTVSPCNGLSGLQQWAFYP